MVDFTLTDDQQRMREMAHDFAEGEFRPVAWQLVIAREILLPRALEQPPVKPRLAAAA